MSIDDVVLTRPLMMKSKPPSWRNCPAPWTLLLPSYSNKPPPKQLSPTLFESMLAIRRLIANMYNNHDPTR